MKKTNLAKPKETDPHDELVEVKREKEESPQRDVFGHEVVEHPMPDKPKESTTDNKEEESIDTSPSDKSQSTDPQFVYTEDDMQKLTEAAYLRGRNEAIAAQYRIDSSTQLPDQPADKSASMNFPASRRSVWQMN